jgi:hypothetical protein
MSTFRGGFDGVGSVARRHAGSAAPLLYRWIERNPSSGALTQPPGRLEYPSTENHLRGMWRGNDDHDRGLHIVLRAFTSEGLKREDSHATLLPTLRSRPRFRHERSPARRARELVGKLKPLRLATPVAEEARDVRENLSAETIGSGGAPYPDACDGPRLRPGPRGNVEDKIQGATQRLDCSEG